MQVFNGKLAQQAWMIAPETVRVMEALHAGGGSARFVGGCVRDALVNRNVIDIDIATPLQPDQVIERLVAAKIKYAPTGLKHGTVTAIVDGHPFEITTLRVDVNPLGRHAEVAWPVTQQEQRQDQRDAQQGDHHQQRDAPAIAFRQARDDRQEGQLAGGVGRRQNADDQAALLREPARRHRGAQHDRRHAGAAADHDPPEQGQLPDALYAQRQAQAADDQQQGGRHDAL